MQEMLEFVLLIAISALVITAAIAFIRSFSAESRKARMYERYVSGELSRHCSVTEADVQGICASGEQCFDAKVAEKKKRFMDIGSIIFHYADKENIENLYHDRFKEPLPESIIEETERESLGDMRGEAGFNGVVKLSGGKSERSRSKITSSLQLPKGSVNHMFLRYQREAIREDSVLLGLELVDVELSEVENFEKLLQKLESRYHLVIGKEQAEKAKAVLLTKAVGSTLQRLEKAEGFVLMEGLFYITEVNGDYYKCILRHPVSDYLGSLRREMAFYMLLRKDRIESAFVEYYRHSVGEYILLRVFGRIFQPLDPEKEHWEVAIVPLAVY